MATTRFISSLESARGLAALTVCLFHAAGIRYRGAPLIDEGSATATLLNGYGAVVLFFVLSGYVLRSSLDGKVVARPLALAADFLLARAFRLFPVIIATIIVFAIVAWLVRGQQPQLSPLLRNALLLDVTMDGAFWTLQVEVFGSVLVLLAFLTERRLGIWPVVVITIALIPLSFLGSSAFVGDAVNTGFFYTFLFGYLLSALPRELSHSFRSATAMICVALIVFYWVNMHGNAFKGWMLLATTVSASVIVFVLATSHFRKSIQWRPIRNLGMLSYSFYAIHPLGLELVQYLAEPIGQADPSRSIAVPFLLFMSAAAAFLLALPMNYFVEHPGILVGRHVIEVITLRRARSKAGSDNSTPTKPRGGARW